MYKFKIIMNDKEYYVYGDYYKINSNFDKKIYDIRIWDKFHDLVSCFNSNTPMSIIQEKA